MQEPVKSPPADVPAPPPAPPAAAHISEAPPQPAVLETPTAHDAKPTADKLPTKQSNISKKPIFIIVFSIVLFVLLSAVALYAYSQSN